MKALSLLQPWASLVAVGAKRYETRSWYTGHRGCVAIAASKGFPGDCRELLAREPFGSGRVRDFEYLAWIHTLTCAAAHLPGHVCEGSIEADHVGARPLGRKCDDNQTIALCTLAHRQRTDHCGPFRHFTREDMRAFVADALAFTADAWRRHTAADAARSCT